MNLIVDVGNTFFKVAVFENDKLTFVESVLQSNVAKVFTKIKAAFGSIENAIVSSVSDFEIPTLNHYFPSIKIILLNHKTKLPFKNLYKTPETLGVDRMALVASAIKKFPKKNALVIDAGTCITYDFVNANKEYFGGSIAPGIQMRYKSLADYTAKLPLLSPKFPEEWIGDSTENAIHSGICVGVIAEIEGIIDQFSNKYEHLVVILTGGDANFLSKRFKNSIFVDSKFLLHGLNYILEHTID